MSLTQVTVLADRTNADGTVPAGILTFTLSGPIANGSEIVGNGPITVPVLAGVATAILYANDDTGTTPVGNSYGLLEELEGAPARTYSITVAAAGPNPKHI